MTETFSLLFALIWGTGLGVFFFGGLWWTVRWGLYSKQPALWFLGSSILRITIILAGFFYVADSNWKHMAVCLLGFVIARIGIKWLTRTVNINPDQARRSFHAS